MGGQEGSSAETRLDSSNIGFQLLKKHGWKEGTGLGISQQGRLEPVQTYLQIKKQGLGTDKAIRCEICNIDCNSKDVLDRHMLGKKHRRNLQLQLLSITTVPTTPEVIQNINLGKIIPGDSSATVGGELEMKKVKLLENGVPVDSMLFCTLCNVACNSQAVFNTHLSGKKHAAKVSEQLGTTPITGTMDNPEESEGKFVNVNELKRKVIPSQETEEDIETKRRKIIEGGAAAGDIRECTICNVVCNSPLVFRYHLTGQKHVEMLKKHAESGTATTSTSESQDQVVTAS